MVVGDKEWMLTICPTILTNQPIKIMPTKVPINVSRIIYYMTLYVHSESFFDVNCNNILPILYSNAYTVQVHTYTYIGK